VSPFATITTLPEKALPEQVPPTHILRRSYGSHTGERQTSRTLLVVENDLVVQDMIRQALEIAGYRVLLQEDQTDSCHWIDQILHYPPHLILLDVSMRRPDPYEYLSQFHRRWQLHPPVIVLTTHPTIQLNLSIAGYQVVLKPFHLQALFDTIGNAFMREGPIMAENKQGMSSPFLQEYTLHLPT
jgi:DNA-binding response OmpR family regulator